MAAQQVNKIDYEFLEEERSKELRADLTRRLRSTHVGGSNTLRHIVMKHVVSSEYDMAKEAMNVFFADRTDFPFFADRSRRHQKHIEQLMGAIKAKRELPEIAQLSLAKRQELFDRVEEHYVDMKGALKQIEMIDKELRIEDLRSTVIPVKTFFACLFVILGIALLQELSSGAVMAFVTLVDTATTDLVNWIFDLF